MFLKFNHLFPFCFFGLFCWCWPVLYFLILLLLLCGVADLAVGAFVLSKRIVIGMSRRKPFLTFTGGLSAFLVEKKKKFVKVYFSNLPVIYFFAYFV